MPVDDRARRIAALLRETAETHHVVYRITDGDDPDWASWYAGWLLDLSELPEISGHDLCEAISCTRSSSSIDAMPRKLAASLGSSGTPPR
ncbi:MAG TPA: hypothetical protein VFU34_01860 [Gaiellaceae bacterium]|nr:hypothetical protein [Gaiellaceae bacterium]